MTAITYTSCATRVHHHPYSQVSDKSKVGLGYKELILESFVNSYELLEKHDNRSDKGYHEVPPPITGNYMPPKRDLRLIDEHFESESVNVSIISSSDVKTVDHKDDDSEDELSPTVEVKTVKPSVEKIESIKTAREIVKTEESLKQHKHHPRENQRNWNNLMSHRLRSNFVLKIKRAMSVVNTTKGKVVVNAVKGNGFNAVKASSRTLHLNIGTSSRRSLGVDDVSKQGRNLKQRSIFKERDFYVQAVMDVDYELATRLRAEE
uniref:Uncharacterized protein n=1 Tax=Tanacetum cinerariifolium TaxID=118510 RepID=A0A6L2N176_TANCI|nr:hypothetical protein [Tanacetum cinerariifolium]